MSAVSFKVTSDSEHKSYSLQCETGDIAFEIFDKLFYQLCTLLSVYNQLYLLRDVSPVAKFSTVFQKPPPHPLHPRNELHFLAADDLFFPAGKGLCEAQRPVSRSVTRIFTLVDELLTNRSSRVKLSLGNVTVGCYENIEKNGKVVVLPSPVFVLNAPPAAISLQGAENSNKVVMEICGINICCTKSCSFAAMFLKVWFF